MADLTGHRVAGFTVTLLDADEQEKGLLDGVTGGDVTLSAATRLRASGTLQVDEVGQQIDWGTDRVRIDYEANGQAWPIGVFLLSAPTQSFEDGMVSRRVELLGKLAVIDQDATVSTLSLASGTRVTDAVRQILAEAGETRMAVTDSPETLKSQMVWDPGTSKLTVINDLLDAIGYWALSPDGAGVLQVRPYVRPAARPQSWTFAEGEQAVHSAKWDLEQDLADVPNRVVLVGQGSDDKPALVGVASNEDPDSPFGFPARGRWVTRTETGVEASSQEVIDSLARRRLIDASTPVATIRMTHMPLPLSPNDLVTWDTGGHKARATIHEIAYGLDPTALCRTTLKEVVDL
ncbi:hypothetical protein I6B53_03235 [Schaalia sp. 19OD2882]|uniref:hypothetical protein n=1 Tax=Schaalia sp. 19OD2882 TaxID=2794089 RepID=UPI001C1EE72F|nr:hypothetical protein [Schaalia sp. 19OD2882]QWW20124.1 hypothetical protein I6B53_03235 [Schaalia sp. 19OD2882]